MAPIARTYKGQSHAIQDKHDIKAIIDTKACYLIGTTRAEVVVASVTLDHTVGLENLLIGRSDN